MQLIKKPRDVKNWHGFEGKLCKTWHTLVAHATLLPLPIYWDRLSKLKWATSDLARIRSNNMPNTWPPVQSREDEICFHTLQAMTALSAKHEKLFYAFINAIIDNTPIPAKPNWLIH
ncbi:hypothetical protein J9978_07675 [Chromobacterium violaceum]|uniref:hypothetical protein n=1 Tax=Chromobacterium violaceum TaxID=536 RepID=UPI001B33B4B6|nr:hypothetical protein [Chromobacterium violaceum]MBP4049377.1 hypothetical protein [Chromobacterium violaceum]